MVEASRNLAERVIRLVFDKVVTNANMLSLLQNCRPINLALAHNNDVRIRSRTGEVAFCSRAEILDVHQFNAAAIPPHQSNWVGSGLCHPIDVEFKGDIIRFRE